ncbi:MAG: GGDEF domain-containing protein [Planctomycetia bacterium]|nr:GGDEF domain-containing protein [Planctomycetia bacterium]
MKESLYDRFRPFKPYDMALAVVMILLVALSTDAALTQRLLIAAAGLSLFLVLDFVQRLVAAPTPRWQALLIIGLNTAFVTLLVQLKGANEFTLAFYMLNVGFATVAFGEQVGIATALLSVLAQMQLSFMTGSPQRPLVETALMLALLLTLTALLTRINRMQQHAVFDAVTGLRNHRYFQVRLRDELKRSDRQSVATALLLLDLDDFKKVNDQHGHTVGDQVLRLVGTVLERNARAADVVCRYGGEEFAAILPETGLMDAAQVAERFCRAVRESTSAPRVTLSIGVACYPEHGATSDQLLAAADTALYRAKDAGKNCVKVAARE